MKPVRMVFKFAIFISKKLNFCVLFLHLQFEGGVMHWVD